jgi:hypothetical protein
MADRNRRWPRIDLALNATVRIGSLVDAVPTLNVSREGLFLRTDAPRPVGTPVTVTVALPTGEFFQAEGVVVHVQPDPDGETPSIAERPAGMGIFLTTTTGAWREFSDLVERTRNTPPDEVTPRPRRGGRRKGST